MQLPARKRKQKFASYAIQAAIYEGQSIKITKGKKLCKSEQRELDAVCHTFSVMYMPLGDLRE